MIEYMDKYVGGGGGDCEVNGMIISQVLGADEYCFTILLIEQVWVRKQELLILNQRKSFHSDNGILRRGAYKSPMEMRLLHTSTPTPKEGKS
jgi:hypothetical protein